MINNGLLHLAICLGVGVITEFAAYLAGLWTYRRTSTLIFNLLAMFGLGFGSLSLISENWSLLAQITAGTAIGIAYEFANLRWFDLWYFKGNRLLFLKGDTALITGVGFLWGAVLPLSHFVRTLF